MSLLNKIIQQIHFEKEQIKLLQTQYHNNHKGQVYTKRMNYHLQKIKQFNFELKMVGTITSICRAQIEFREDIGPNLTKLTRHEVFYSGLPEVDVEHILRANYTNIQKIKVELIQPGKARII